MSNAERKIAVVGLGYVGLPVAVAFGQRQPVIGFDISEKRIRELRDANDQTGEVSSPDLAKARIQFTNDPQLLREADFIIVAVPTPVDRAKRPDLSALIQASRTVGTHLKKDSIVVYESTVYPGTTEEVCVPVLEEASGLRSRRDFWVAYSPERINPGDRTHQLKDIIKVVSGQTEAVTEIVAAVYSSVVQAGVHRASSIKVAEAAKVIENTQRDLNIALMNELSIIFGRMGIDTADVLSAAQTKWNFLPFRPGLVGGHCIGVDPFYLTHKAEELGYHPQVILAGRRINDGMGEYVAEKVILNLIKLGACVGQSRVTVLGATFKENVKDLRNSGVMSIISKLRDYQIEVQVHDPVADGADAGHYGLNLLPLSELLPAKAVLFVVPHKSFIDGGWNLALSLLENQKGFVADVRGILPREMKPSGVELWRL